MHEIDIMAYNKRNIIAIECKNYAIPVGIKEIRDFKSKLNDYLNKIKEFLESCGILYF